VHLSDEVPIIADLFEDSLLPAVEELSNCCFDSSNGHFIGSRGVVNLEE